MSALQGITLPFKVIDGEIVDGLGKPIMEVNDNNAETPLTPMGRDAMLSLTCKLLNDAFTYDHADRILHELGY